MAQLSTTSLATDTNLKLYLKFENDGNDSSGNGYNMTVVGSAGYTSGKYGQGKVFTNGETGTPSDYCWINNQSAFSPGTGDFSVGGWFKFTNKQNLGRVFTKYDSVGSSVYILWFTSNGYAVIYFRDSTGSQAISVTGSTDLSDGNWHFVCGVKDGKTARLYVDSSTEIGNNTNNSLGSVNTDAANVYLFLGAYGGGTGLGGLQDNPESFIGTMDDLFIFNRKLTTTEIGTLITDTVTSRVHNLGTLGVGA